MVRKLFKWFGVFLLGLVVCIGLIYGYLAAQTGEPAARRAVFESANRRLLVFAHRGGGGIFPENTLEAFRHAARIGVDVQELDVHATADGTLVVLHDRTVDRTTDGSGRVDQLTLEQIKKLDAGFRFSSDGGRTFPFRGKKITVPTLEEVFSAFPEMTFNVEPKQETPSIIKPLCEIVRRKRMADKVIVGSFRQGVMDEFRRECPEVATSATPSEVSQFLTMYKTGIAGSYTPPMHALQVPENIGSLQIVSKEFVEAAHRLNLKVHVWTINNEADMRRLIEMGVDGIMTDYPDLLLNMLGRSTQVE